METSATGSAPTRGHRLPEAQERFLRAIADRVPVERIIEVHLFPSLRQGGMESGLAVIAAIPDGVDPALFVAGSGAAAAVPAMGPDAERATPETLALDAPDEAGPPPDEDPASDEGAPGDAVAADREVAAVVSAVPDAGTAPGVPPEEAADLALAGVAAVDVEGADAPSSPDGPTVPAAEPEDPGAQADPTDAAAGDAPASEEPGVAGGPADPVLVALDAADATTVEEITAAEEPAPRPVIYSARYRLVIKGPDRGKWEADVVAEADAPLVTVDAVVRGVRKRAGDDADSLRLSAADVRAAAAGLPFGGAWNADR